MTIIPTREIGKLGVISDQNDHDLPGVAWSDANNLRFSRGVVSRYSVFKYFDKAYNYAAQRPVGIVEAGGTEGTGFVVTVMNDGSMEQRIDATTTDVTPTGTLTTNNGQITTCELGTLTYVNRHVDVPIYRENPGDGAFVPIPGWTSTDRCRSLRSYKDFLIALNVTKGSVSYPSMIKWSDAAQVGAPPDDWDTTDLSSLSGENVLNDCREGLVDGLSLGDTFILYGASQTFRMDFIGEPLVFRTAKVFDDQGVMAPNCAVSVEGRHYVFGNSDIYMHDGLSKKSIADGRVLERVMNELDWENRDRCFVYHDNIMGEIGFCYPSKSSDAKWQLEKVNGCNRAMVYNYRSDTWSPVDMPSVVGVTEASQADTQTWADMPSKWTKARMTWDSLQSVNPSALLLCSTGNGAVAGQPYFLDLISSGRISAEEADEVLWWAWGKMLYKDMDELGVELYGRKLIRSVDLQFGSKDSESEIRFRLGQSRGPNTAIKWGRKASFNAWGETRYDCRINDRYLALRIEYPSGVDVDFGGFDLDFNMIAKR